VFDCDIRIVVLRQVCLFIQLSVSFSRHTRSALSFSMLCVWDISLAAIPERNAGVRNSVDLTISFFAIPGLPARFSLVTKRHTCTVRKPVCSPTCRLSCRQQHAIRRSSFAVVANISLWNYIIEYSISVMYHFKL